MLPALHLLMPALERLERLTERHHVSKVLVSEGQQGSVVDGSPDIPGSIVCLLERNLHKTGHMVLKTTDSRTDLDFSQSSCIVS